MSELRELADGLWVIDHPFRVGGLHFGTRTTLVRTSEGLWMHSPGPLGGGVREQIAALGEVRHIVAPNTMHYLFFEENRKAFPQARGWAGPALRAKVPSLPVDDALATASWEGLEALTLDGIPRLEETVFYHPSSRTLIVTDLVFHMRESAHWFTRAFMTMNGAYGRFGPSRLFRRLLVADAQRLGRSLEGVLEWDIERVIMGHGEVLERGGGAAVRDAFAWTHSA